MENIITLLNHYDKVIHELQRNIDRLECWNFKKQEEIKALKNELFEKDIEKIKNQYAFESTIVDLANGKEFLHTNYVHTFAELINKYGYNRVVAYLTELAHAHTPQEEPVNAEPDDDLPFEIDTN